MYKWFLYECIYIYTGYIMKMDDDDDDDDDDEKSWVREASLEHGLNPWPHAHNWLVLSIKNVYKIFQTTSWTTEWLIESFMEHHRQMRYQLCKQFQIGASIS